MLLMLLAKHIYSRAIIEQVQSSVARGSRGSCLLKGGSCCLLVLLLALLTLLAHTVHVVVHVSVHLSLECGYGVVLDHFGEEHSVGE